MPAPKRRKTRKKPVKKRKKPAKQVSQRARKASKQAQKRKSAAKPVKRAVKHALPRKRKSTVSKRKSAAKQKRKVAKRKLPAKRKAAVKKRKLPAKRKAVAKKRKLPAKKKAARKKRKLPATGPKLRVTSEKLPVTKPVSIAADAIYHISLGDPGGYEEPDKHKKGEEVMRFRTFSTGMTKSNRNFGPMFEQALEDFAKKTPFEPGELPIYRFGISITTRQWRKPEQVKHLTHQFAAFMRNFLPKGATSHIVNEGNYLSVTMNLGNYRRPATAEDVSQYVQDNQDLFEQFVAGSADIASDIAWFEFWDTEEMYYE